MHGVIVPLEAIMDAHELRPEAFRIYCYLCSLGTDETDHIGTSLMITLRDLRDINMATLKRSIGNLFNKGWLVEEKQRIRLVKGFIRRPGRLKRPLPANQITIALKAELKRLEGGQF